MNGDPIAPPPGEASPHDVDDGNALGLRAAGFLLTVLGALLAGIGSMLDWISVTIPDLPPELVPTLRGVDTTEGKLVLAAAVIAAIAVLVTRIGNTASARRGAAIAVLVLGVAVVAIAARELLTAEDRYVDDAVGEVREVAGSLGVAEADIEGMLDELTQAFVVEAQIGVWLSLVGGIAIVAGGAVTWAWTRRRDAEAGGGAQPDGGSQVGGGSGPEVT
jgi:hypothetical protein